MIRARTTVYHLDDVWKLDLACNFFLRNRVARGRGKEVTSVTGIFTMVLLPSAVRAVSEASDITRKKHFINIRDVDEQKQLWHWELPGGVKTWALKY